MHSVFEELSSSPHLLLEITRSAVRILPSATGTHAGFSSSRPNKRPRHG